MSDDCKEKAGSDREYFECLSPDELETKLKHLKQERDDLNRSITVIEEILGRPARKLARWNNAVSGK